MTIADTFEKNWKETEAGCWEWQRAVDGNGYGKLYIGGGRRAAKFMAAHRFSYELANGEIPEGLHVCHRCDNPICVRPDHLFLGTNTDNRLDSVRKGRAAHGAGHGGAKITAGIVRLIRAAHSAGESQRALGRVHGISQTQVSRIVHGQRWASV